MLKIDLYLDEWAKDSVMEKDDLGNESLNIPKLHSKYMKFLSKDRVEFKLTLEKKRLKEAQLLDYYNGVIDGKDINREPWNVIESKSSAEKRVLNDRQIVAYNLKIHELEEAVLLVKEIINNINQRGYQIKNSIDWLKWSQGSTV